MTPYIQGYLQKTAAYQHFAMPSHFGGLGPGERKSFGGATPKSPGQIEAEQIAAQYDAQRRNDPYQRALAAAKYMPGSHQVERKYIVDPNNPWNYMGQLTDPSQLSYWAQGLFPYLFRYGINKLVGGWSGNPQQTTQAPA